MAPNSYSYQVHPVTWVQVGNSINIPVAETNPGGMWAIKVIVTDALGNKLQRSLVIKISNGGDPLIGDYPYDQTFTFDGNGAIVSIPTSTAIVTSSTTQKTTSSSSSTSTSNLNNGASFGSASSTTGTIALQASGTGVNVALPTSAQLDVLINSGDVVKIRQTIQKVISSTLACAAKGQYLSSFLGRIETFIAIKKTQAAGLTDILESTQAQIANLRAQIAEFTQSMKDLNIPSLQAELSSVLNSLQDAYNAFNAGNVDLTPFNLNITANIQSITNLTGQRDKTKTQLGLDKKSLADTESLIRSLEKQLAAARQNKQKLEARILVHNANIATFTSQIDLLNANNVALNNKINSINANRVQLQANAHLYETKAENIKSTINARQAQQSRYQAQIDTLNAQILQINGNLNQRPISRLQQTVISLEAEIPSLQKQIDFVKFKCLGVVNYTVQTLNGQITYVFASSVFSTYVTEQFGQSQSNTAQALLGPISTVNLTPTTIFDDRWIKAFGESFTSEKRAISAMSSSSSSGSGSGSSSSSGSSGSSGSGSGSGSGSSSSSSTGSSSSSISSSQASGLLGTGTSSASSVLSTNFFISDFPCQSNVELKSASGVVSSITANVMHVTTQNGDKDVLILGACSNILVLNAQVPRIGSNVFWNGRFITSNTYQVYSALFI